VATHKERHMADLTLLNAAVDNGVTKGRTVNHRDHYIEVFPPSGEGQLVNAGVENQSEIMLSDLGEIKRQSPLKKERISGHCTIFIIVGAAEEFAVTFVYPALSAFLTCSDLPEDNIFVVGFSQRDTSASALRKRCSLHMDFNESFWASNRYAAGSYEDPEQLAELTTILEDVESDYERSTRVLLLATDYSEYSTVTSLFSCTWSNFPGFVSLVAVNPFALGPTSSAFKVILPDIHLTPWAARTLTALRFANPLFAAAWNNRGLVRVEITLKVKTTGLFGNVLLSSALSHLLHVMALVAADAPLGTSESDLQLERKRALRQIRLPAVGEDEGCLVLGHIADGDKVKDHAQFVSSATKNSVSFIGCLASVDKANW